MGTSVWTEIARLALALAVGMAIGLEREWREKAAGFRTITIVAVGAALFVMLANYVVDPTAPARIAAGVVTGIGFLGAGSILRDRGQVTGLTTAAAVWLAAALGMAAGFGAYALTIVGTVLALVVLLVFPRVDISVLGKDTRTYEIVSPYNRQLHAELAERFRRRGLSVDRQYLSKRGDDVVSIWRISGRPDRQLEIMHDLVADPAIREFDVQ